MHRAIIALIAILALLIAAPSPAHAQAARCQYVLGFATLHSLDPIDVGDCVDNQAFAGNGDAVQHTTKGLLVWRKTDNWTAFTDGYRTWINGPYGVEGRENTQRLSWEAAGGWQVSTTCVSVIGSGRTNLDGVCGVAASDPDGARDVAMLAFDAADSPVHIFYNPALVTPELGARLTLLAAPIPGSATGPVPPYAILVQSDGGLPGNLLFSQLPGGVVDIADGNFQTLAVHAAQEGGRWLISDVSCAGDPSRSVMRTPGGWLNCLPVDW